MGFIEKLNTYGVDTEAALRRFMNNPALYEKMLIKFADTIDNYEVEKYLVDKDEKMAMANAHSLKGVTGNLSLQPLYKGYSDVVAEIRNGDLDKALEILKQILPVQEGIVSCIKNG
jgi:HPt (histidine-containing phosphotransfer) domain-containing protein